MYPKYGNVCGTNYAYSDLIRYNVISLLYFLEPKSNFSMLMNTFNDFKSTTGKGLDRLNNTLERIADQSESK